MIKKLQTALNLKGQQILYSTKQFYSLEQNRPITVYKIKKAVWDEEKQKFQYINMFESCSQIQVVLYLKEMWEELNAKNRD
jgi:hypothetical protein